MTSLAIILVLSSAFTHALWNYLSKRAIGGVTFIWLFGVMEVAFYFPAVLFITSRESINIGGIEIVMILGSTAFHVFYFLALSRGYQVGDLSIVYPFSRGIGPLLSTIAAIIILHERPTIIAFVGTILITLGIIWLTGNPRKFRAEKLTSGLFYAGVTGSMIAGYTIWDRYAVYTLHMSPFIYEWSIALLRLCLFTPFAIRQWDSVKTAWKYDKWKAAGVGVLSSFSYILMLFALSYSPVSYVAPLRSISILMSVVMGAYLLKEGNVQKRFGAASVMVFGAILLGLG